MQRTDHASKQSSSRSGPGTATSAGSSPGKRTLVDQEMYSATGAVQRTATSGGIPQNFNIAFQSEITGPKRGIRVQNQHESDSGTVGDLNEVRISEVVQYGGGTGSLAGITSGNNSGYRSGTAFPTDSHGTPVALLTGAGHIDAQQTFKFLDHRSGANDIPVKNSGYQISRDITDDGSGNISITTSKAGNAGTARGNTSDAGSGSASRTQAK